MKMYQVKNGVARMPVGTVMALDASQYAGREHNVDVVKTDRKSGAVVVRVKGLVEFKVGQRIGLATMPKVLQQVLEEATAESAAA